ncbi:DUF2630 family protein [Arthrobacter sp. FB24]|nr:DUF2630 family protein [Arthrobacter sp. FB24]
MPAAGPHGPQKQYGENPDEAEVRPVKQVEDYRG